MSNTLVEKLLIEKTGKKNITPGDIITVPADRVVVHDLFAPFVIRKFQDMGFKKVWDQSKIVFVYDHLVPTSRQEDFYHHKATDDFSEAQGITNVHRADGVCHQLMPEQRYVMPGDIVFGTDSHTTTYGAVGSFATGIGYTEMAAIFGTGELWIKVPATIRIVVNGDLPPGVSSKDLILKIIGDIKADGATYKAMEFCGSTISGMSISSRLTLSNMAVEAGAKVGIIEPDDKTFEFCNINGEAYKYLKSDSNASFESVLEYNAADFLPVVACPPNVDSVKRVEDVLGTKIDQGYLGSCTNGRLEDLEIAANIIKGRKVAPFTRFIVTPASRRVYQEAAKNGIISTLIEAGAIVNQPACGLCCGRTGGIVTDGQVVVSSTNRNFLGRMGSSKSEVYLASPATVTASVIEGKITDPRKYF